MLSLIWPSIFVYDQEITVHRRDLTADDLLGQSAYGHPSQCTSDYIIEETIASCMARVCRYSLASASRIISISALC